MCTAQYAWRPWISPTSPLHYAVATSKCASGATSAYAKTMELRLVAPTAGQSTTRNAYGSSSSTPSSAPRSCSASKSLTLAPVLIPFAMPQCRPIVCRNLRTSLPELCAGGYLGTPSIFAWLDSASVRSAGAALILLRLASVCKAQCFCRQTVVLVTTDVLARALRRSLIPIVSHR